MMTGDAAINRQAPIICCTAEIRPEPRLREDRGFWTPVVMDEFHYYGDKDQAWPGRCRCSSAPGPSPADVGHPLGDVTHLGSSLTEVTGREVAEVRSAQRPALEFRYAVTPPRRRSRTSHENKAPGVPGSIPKGRRRAGPEPPLHRTSAPGRRSSASESLVEQSWGPPSARS